MRHRFHRSGAFCQRGFAQAPPDLLVPVVAAPAETQELARLAADPTVVRSRLMTINRDLLAELAANPAAGRQMELDLFPDDSEVVQVQTATVDDLGIEEVTGTMAGEAAQLHSVVQGDGGSGSVDTGERFFQLQSVTRTSWR